MRRLFFFCLLCGMSLGLLAQTRFRAMSYNVENLFDIHHDSLKNDYEYLPESDRHWDATKFWHKIQGIAKVISAVGEDQLPDVVGLCEVENDSCLIYLTKRSALRTAGYAYVMTHSEDERGVDVALLYQPARFKPVQVECINVHPERIHQKKTRDILHVTGKVQSGALLDVYMCHMPSRGGGKEDTAPFRDLTAQVLKHSVDSVLKARPDARVLIMGDFNDYPKDKALSKVLAAGRWKGIGRQAQRLYNLMFDVKPGSYRYQGEWNTLDQLFVNGNLLPAQAHVFMADWLVQKDETYGGVKPFRTYAGSHYLGGYSDHLPVYLDLIFSSE